MSSRQPRYPKEEFTRRGQQIFESKVQPLVKGEDPYKFVAIDIESGDFEVDADSLAATDRLIAKNPDAQIWMRRVGFPYTHRFGILTHAKRAVLRRVTK